jgi:hypothetical protein
MRRVFHFDFHILMTLLQRGWNIVAGGITVMFMPFWLNSVEQGYYFTFLSLLGMQVFFELGFNSVVVQLVGHEVAHLTVDANGVMAGNPIRVSRVDSLFALLRRWYFAAAVFFFVFAAVAGTLFFSRKGALPMRVWLPPWLAMVFFTSVNLYLSPRLAVFEGFGRVGQVARLRLIQSMIGFALMWVALCLKGGLAAVPIWTAVTACSSLWWVKSGNTLLRELSRPKSSSVHRMSWHTEIFPLQWRIAVSWISGYFIFQTFTPLVFAHQGPVEAGRLGVALTIFSSLGALGMSWVNASASQMGQYISRGERNHLNALFSKVLISSTIFTLLAGLAFLLFVWVLRYFGVPVAGRIASLPIIASLALVSVVNSFINGAAVYMRAHKQEPMLVPSVVGGITTLAIAYFGSMVNSLLPVVLWALSTLLIGLPWTICLFIPFYRGKK